MTGKDKSTKLRQENEELKRQLQEAQNGIRRLSEQVVLATPNSDEDGEDVHDQSKETAKSMTFLGKQYDDLDTFRMEARKSIASINERLRVIGVRLEEIGAAIDDLQDYSYQYNIKIVGMPSMDDKESAEETSSLCLTLFRLIGATNVCMQDIDIAHRVPTRRQTDLPKAIICKFTRRLAREQVMTRRKEIYKIQASQLGFDSHVQLNLGLYDHLSPRKQALMIEAKKFKSASQFKYFWSKGGSIFLRQDDKSRIIKINKLEDLQALDPSATKR